MFDHIFEIVFLVGYLIYFFGVYTPNMRRFKGAKVVEDRTRVVDAITDFTTFAGWQVLPLIAILSPWLDFANFPLPGWAGWLGTLIFAGTIVLLWRAYADLGSQWSPKIDIREGQVLVTGGIYGYIRHPIYAGLWLWAIAQPLLLQNWLAGFALLVLFTPLYFTRMPREEGLMLDHFGEEYRAYMGRTGRILPRFRR